MSSEVETSPGISRLSREQRCLDYARGDKSKDATRSLFETLAICHDEVPRSASMNMSIDEAVLESATVPTIRFYCWRSPALSFGYFGRFSDVSIYATERDLVRRWTGGGIVFHGADLTYSIAIPANDPAFYESSIAIYERIHRALAHALNETGKQTKLIELAGRTERTPQRGVPADNCFTNPVRADVMMEGRKIAGAAQRRTRRGLLHQGSIQGFAMKPELTQIFARALSGNCGEFEITQKIFQRASQLAQEKYGTATWLRKR